MFQFCGVPQHALATTGLSMQHTICIFGGTGFVGHHLARALTAAGHRVRIPSRHPERHRDLRVFPGLQLIQGDVVHDGFVMRKALAGCDVAINLIGILNEKRDNGRAFHAIHVALVERMLNACREKQVSRFLHMSALNADPARGSSYYLRSKGEGETRVHSATGIEATSFRPSVIFGRDDHFINRFADLLRKSPILPLACAGSRFAPVFVEDVVQAFVRSLDKPATIGQRYNLCGPREYTLREIVEYLARELGLKRTIIGLGPTLSKLQAMILQRLPGQPFTLDNFRSLQTDSVCPEGDSVLREVFGIEPTPMEAVVPLYLRPDSLREHYTRWRQTARRP